MHYNVVFAEEKVMKSVSLGDVGSFHGTMW